MIDVLSLFPKLDSSLIEALSGLSSEQWNKDTICKKWKVKDIAAHLLDSGIRRLSFGRDDYQGASSEINNQDELLENPNNLNADWVNAYDRVSSAILIAQLKTVQEELYLYFKDLDPSANAMFPVSWAGEEISDQRFDIAREFTERWLHQQQIRQAVGARLLMNRDLYNPFLEICMMALPYHFKDFSPVTDTMILVEIVGDAGGVWKMVRGDQKWEFSLAERPADAHVYIDQNIAWMLFSGGIDIYEAGQYWQVTGDQDLGRHALLMRSFIV
jgi:uncharacterized protein (TIGR03083 family)